MLTLKLLSPVFSILVYQTTTAQSLKYNLICITCALHYCHFFLICYTGYPKVNIPEWNVHL